MFVPRSHATYVENIICSTEDDESPSNYYNLQEFVQMFVPDTIPPIPEQQKEPKNPMDTNLLTVLENRLWGDKDTKVEVYIQDDDGKFTKVDENKKTEDQLVEFVREELKKKKQQSTNQGKEQHEVDDNEE